MKYEINKEQYERLLSARDNWPKELNHGIHTHQDPGCVMIYLANNMNKASIALIYEYYGIPMKLCHEWVEKNDRFYILGRRGRSRAMKKIFKEFLDNVVIQEEEKEFSDTQNNLDDYIEKENFESKKASEKEELILVGK